MAVKRLSAIVFSHAFFVVLAVALAVPLPLYGGITPEREIIPLDSARIPQWKKYWDAGREMARQGNMRAAAQYYKDLIRKKPQIEEARWEYCKVLFELHDYDSLSNQLESLIEANPYRLDYQDLAGRVALKKGDYSKAVSYLGQVYSQHPQGREGVRALAGLVEGLQRLGRKSYAFVLMEELYQRRRNDPVLLHELARYAYELGFNKKARDYYSTLIDNFPVDKILLMEAADMYADTGHEGGAARFWQEYLQRDPKYLPYQRKLLRYWLDNGKPVKALPHMLAIIRDDPRVEPELLLSAGRIYFKEMHRADKALRFYEKYLQMVPSDHEAADEMEAVRQTIASELLAIVENGGADRLWEDLQKLTGNSLAIFRLMAADLEKQGKIEPLISVLRLTYFHGGGDDATALRLADLYSSVGNFQAAFTFLDKVRGDQYHTADYYLKRGRLARKVGKGVVALKSFLQAVRLRPHSLEARREGIRLAGRLGFYTALEQLGAPLESRSISRQDLDLCLTYLESMRLNGMFAEAGGLYRRLLAASWLSAQERGRILLHQATTLRMKGEEFAAQQVLRDMLVEGIEVKKAALMLIDCSLDSKANEDGWALFGFLTDNLRDQSWKTSYDEYSRRLLGVYIRLLQADGELSRAIGELKQYLERWEKSTPSPHAREVSAAIGQLCGLYLQAGEVDKLKPFLGRFSSQESQSVEIRFFRALLSGGGKLRAKQYIRETLAAHSESGGVPGLFSSVALAQRFHDDTAALAMLNRISRLYPQSLRARVMKASLLRRSGKIAQATVAYLKLHRQYPHEPFFFHGYLQLEFRQGHYRYVLDQLKRSTALLDSFASQLLEARSLWGLDKQQQSLDVYQAMLNPPVNTLFQKRLKAENLAPEKQKTEGAGRFFRRLFTTGHTNYLDRLNGLAEKDGFLSLLNSPEAKILAGLYAQYRWEKVVRQEYSFRKAVEENRYIAAEKQSKRSIQEEKNPEGLIDLAKVYQRLGDYGKEAEVYKTLEKEGEKTPELEASIRRNQRALAPTTAATYGYLQKKGREGAIDMVKQSAGFNLRFVPHVSSEFHLDLNRIAYQQEDGDQDNNGLEVQGQGKIDFSDTTSLDFNAGLHMLDSPNADTIVVGGVRLDRQLDELLKGYLVYDRGVVDDTLEALRQAIYTESAAGGLELEGDTGLNVGAEYRRRWYSDENNEDRISLWSSYSIFSEYLSFQIKYSYQLVKTSLANEIIADPESGVVSNSLPYWSPGDYWRHQLSFRLHHLLQHFDVFGKAPSYYTLNFAVGYESEKEIIYSGGFDIFLEMSDNFLLKGNLLFAGNSDYDERSASVSLVYRW